MNLERWQADSGAAGACNRPVSVYFAFVGAFAAYVSLCLTGIVAVARAGLETPLWALSAGPLVLIASVFSPFLLRTRARAGLEAQPGWFAILVLGTWLSPILSLLVGSWLAVVYPAAAVIGFVRALPALRRLSRLEVLVLVVLPPIVATYIFSLIHLHPYAHVLSPELALTGDAGSPDTALHVALSTMIQNFGQPSAGIDGLVPMRYHVGSHTWFAGLATIADVKPLLAYPLGQICVAVPMLYAAVFLATGCLTKRLEDAACPILIATLVIWALDWIGWTSYYISESFTFGLAALLLVLPLLIDLIEHPHRAPRNDELRMAILLAAAALLCSMKLSVGYVYCSALGYSVLRVYGFSWRGTVLLSILGLVALVSLYFFAARSGLSLSETFSPLHFYLNMKASRSLDPAKAHSSLLLPVIYLILAAWERKREGAARRRPRILTELVAVTTLAAHLPGLTVAMWYASAWWFLNVPQWMLIPLGLARFLPALARRAPPRVLASAVALGLALVAAADITALPSRLTHQVERLQRKVDAIESNRRPRRPARDAAGSAASPARDILTSVRSSPIARAAAWVSLQAEGRPTPAVFVPPGNAPFWIPGSKLGCLQRPLLIPMLTGVPMLKGLSPHCSNRGYKGGYGQGDYGAESHSSVLSNRSLCQHARSRGVRTVLILASLEHHRANSVIDCGAEGPRERRDARIVR